MLGSFSTLCHQLSTSLEAFGRVWNRIQAMSMVKPAMDCYRASASIPKQDGFAANNMTPLTVVAKLG